MHRIIRLTLLVLALTIFSTSIAWGQGVNPPDPVLDLNATIDDYVWPPPPEDYNPPAFTPVVDQQLTPWRTETTDSSKLDEASPATLSAASACATLANPFPYGQCTWWAAEARPDIRRVVRGNAKDWANYIPWYERGRDPRYGDIVIFQPNVQGAHPSYGHVAFVNSSWPVWLGGKLWFYVLEANGPAYYPTHFVHNGVPIRGRWAYKEAGTGFLGRFYCG